jgi:hypothetical protein
MLWRRNLALDSPQLWRNLPALDKNDRGSMEAYQQRTGRMVYVLCLTTGNETNLYWDSLGGGADCRIEFMGRKLVKSLSAGPGIRSGRVVYKKIPELETAIKQNTLNTDDIPFVKRWPYREEKEYRIIWEGTKTKNPPPVKEFDISLTSIASITISDTIPETLFNSIKEIIKAAGQAARTEDLPRISQVTVHGNNRWLDCFKTSPKSRPAGGPNKAFGGEARRQGGYSPQRM